LTTRWLPRPGSAQPLAGPSSTGSSQGTNLNRRERMPDRPVNICVYCSSSDRIEPHYLELAAEVGNEIGRRGHTLVSGGGSISCMGEVARGARALGARTVGVIPRSLLEFEIADLDADELLVTDNMRERKQRMDERSDGFLALPGGIGTLEEVLEAWVALDLGMHNKPVVILDPDGVFALLRAQIDQLVQKGFVHPKARGAVTWATTVPQALDLVEAGIARYANVRTVDVAQSLGTSAVGDGVITL